MATNAKTHKLALQGEQSLQKSVHEALLRKAKLGQDAVVYQDGKMLVISAAELLNKNK